MATYQKINQFPEDLAHKVHNLSSDQLEIILAAAANAPTASDSVRADITEITYTNLTTPMSLTTASSSQTSGTYSLVVNDYTITASGGASNAFRYITVMNTTPTSPLDPLICFFDYGSDLTLNDGQSLVLDFASDGPSTGALVTIS
jgi:hypothetical protein